MMQTDKPFDPRNTTLYTFIVDGRNARDVNYYRKFIQWARNFKNQDETEHQVPPSHMAQTITAAYEDAFAKYNTAKSPHNFPYYFLTIVQSIYPGSPYSSKPDMEDFPELAGSIKPEWVKVAALELLIFSSSKGYIENFDILYRAAQKHPPFMTAIQEAVSEIAQTTMNGANEYGRNTEGLAKHLIGKPELLSEISPEFVEWAVFDRHANLTPEEKALSAFEFLSAVKHHENNNNFSFVINPQKLTSWATVVRGDTRLEQAIKPEWVTQAADLLLEDGRTDKLLELYEAVKPIPHLEAAVLPNAIGLVKLGANVFMAFTDAVEPVLYYGKSVLQELSRMRDEMGKGMAPTLRQDYAAAIMGLSCGIPAQGVEVLRHNPLMVLQAGEAIRALNPKGVRLG